MGLISRAERVGLDLALVFASSEGQVVGRSVNVSESGILGIFQEPLDIWLIGQLTIVTPDYGRIVVEARIVRVDGHDAAMSFLRLSPTDRAFLHKVIEAAV
jgi:hypothetical protein